MLQDLFWVLDNINGFARPTETTTMCCVVSPCDPVVTVSYRTEKPRTWVTGLREAQTAQKLQEGESPNSASEVGGWCPIPSCWSCLTGNGSGVWPAFEPLEDLIPGEGLSLQDPNSIVTRCCSWELALYPTAIVCTDKLGLKKK